MDNIVNRTRFVAMQSAELEIFRRGITPGKDDSFDAFANGVLRASVEFCQENNTTLNSINVPSIIYISL